MTKDRYIRKNAHKLIAAAIKAKMRIFVKRLTRAVPMKRGPTIKKAMLTTAGVKRMTGLFH